MKKSKPESQENLIAFVYSFRNKLNALLGDDPAFTIYEVDEPLPDGTIETREHAHTLNIVCSDVVKLAIARAHIGDVYEDGEKMYIDYYYSRNSMAHVNIKDRPTPNTNLDIAMLFEGNPHFSKFYSGYGAFGPWYCLAFKPELIQYYTEDMTSLHGYRSCAMEDIARDIFTKEEDAVIYFSTERVKPTVRLACAVCHTNEAASNWVEAHSF